MNWRPWPAPCPCSAAITICEPLGNQCHTYGISFWIPLYGTAVNTSDPYAFRSVMCPLLNACYDVRRKDLDYRALRQLFGQWKQTAPYFHRRLLSPHPLHHRSPRLDCLAVRPA